MRKLLLLLAAGAFLVGCIPNQDNPNDPRNAPVVVLRVADGTQPDGSCLAGSNYTALKDLPAAVVLQHNRCLALVPVFVGNQASTFSYQFALVTTSGTQSLAPASSTEGLVLPPSVTSTLPTAVNKFELTLGFDGRGKVVVTASVAVEDNLTPLPPSLHPVRLPVGGFPWAPGKPFLFAFDASSASSPDSDPLRYCWTIGGNPAICSTDPHDPAFSIAIPPEIPGRLVGVVQVCSTTNQLCAPPVQQVVTVAEAALWAPTQGRNNPPGFAQIDADASQHLLPVPGGGSGQVLSQATAGGEFAVAWTDNLNEYIGASVLPNGVLSTASAIEVGAGNIDDQMPIGLSPDGSFLWVGSPSGPGVASTILSGYAVSGTSLTPSVSVTLNSVGGRDQVALTVDPSGNAWVASQLEGWDVFVYGKNGQQTVPHFPSRHGAIPPFQYPPIFSTRPGVAGEVWIYWGGTAQPVLAQYSGSTETDYSVSGSLGAPYWINNDQAWMDVATAAQISLAIVDMQTFLATPTSGISGAITGPSIPLLADAQGLVVDQATGNLWGSLGASAFVASAQTGGVTFFPGQVVGNGLCCFSVDSGGDLWFLDPSFHLFSGASPASLAPATAVAAFPQNLGSAFDWTSGGMWFGTGLGLVRFAPDGLQDRDVPYQSMVSATPQGSESFPFGEIALDPGSSTGWALFLGDGGIARLDLGSTPPTNTTVLTGSSAATIAQVRDANGYFQLVQPVLAPAAPLSGSASFAWTLTSQPLNSGTAQLVAVTVSPSGAVTPAATFRVPAFPPASGNFFAMTTVGAARSLASNALCLATLETVAPYTLQVFWVTTGGGSMLVSNAPVSYDPSFTGQQEGTPAVAVSQVDGTDVCWVGYEETVPDGLGGTQADDRVQAFTAPAGVQVADYALPSNYVLYALRPDGLTDFWAAVEIGINGTFGTQRFVPGQTAGTFTPDVLTTVDAESFVFDESFPRVAEAARP